MAGSADGFVEIDRDPAARLDMPVEAVAAGIEFEIAVENPVPVKVIRTPSFRVQRPTVRRRGELLRVDTVFRVLVGQLIVRVPARHNPAPCPLDVSDAIALEQASKVRLRRAT